jgi:hypothetical protein
VGTKPLIVVSLEGITPNALSCYGCSWNSTPSLDQVCAGGLIWDRLAATIDQPKQVLQSWLTKGAHWADPYQNLGAISLVSDVPVDDLGDHCFDEITIVPVAPVSEDQFPCDEAFETRFGQLIAIAIERLKQPHALGAIWIHSNFLAQCWDAPLTPKEESFADDESLETFDADDDSLGVGLLESEDQDWNPVSNENIPLNVIPPNFEIQADDDPDALPQWMDRYASQVGLVDLLFGYLAEEAESLDARLVFTGISGFRLGQGKAFGSSPSQLRFADVHLPLVISGGGPLRIPHLTSGDQLPKILATLGNENAEHYSCEQWARSRSEAQSIRITSNRSRAAVISPEWFCVIDSDGEENLFLKPDDIDDFNNVARLRPDVIDSLTTLT